MMSWPIIACIAAGVLALLALGVLVLAAAFAARSKNRKPVKKD